MISQQWRAQTLQVGREEGRDESSRAAVEAILTIRFGGIDAELAEAVPVLLGMEPMARTEAAMGRSRDALMALGRRA